jgi:putative phage-type endonuclease
MLRFTPKELNNAKLVGTFESGSQEWHDARAKGIGGSEIGTIMGLNPWESAYALWAKKCKLIPEEKIDNWSMRFGRAFEEPILEMWQQEHPEWEVLTTGTYQDKSMPWRIANPDAIARHLKTGELMVIEVKTARGTWDETPAAYRAQLLWYMDVLGIHQGVIVAVAGWNWEERYIEYDKFESEVMRSVAAKFWQHVQVVERPDWDGSDQTYEVVRRQHSEIDGSTIEIGELADELKIAATEFENAKERFNKIRSKVLYGMGNAKYAVKSLGEKNSVVVASRQARANGAPWLVVK